jgi:hypothetical protein
MPARESHRLSADGSIDCAQIPQYHSAFCAWRGAQQPVLILAFLTPIAGFATTNGC